MGLLAIAAAVSSCGGGSAVANQRNLDSYAGTYTGPWNSPTMGVSGTVTLAINSDGSFDSSKSNAALAGSTTTTPLSGSMDATGKFSGSMLGWNIDGQLSGGGSAIVGSFTIHANGTTYDGNWVLTKQTTTTGG